MNPNRRDLALIGSGLILGSTLVGVSLYFGVIRKYIPLKDLEKEIAALSEQKASLCRQIDAINKDYPKLQKEHDDQVERYEKEISFYEDQLQLAKEDIETWSKKQVAARAMHDYSGNDDIHPDDDLDDPPVDIGPEQVVLNDNPRWNGPLTEDEQRQYDEANGDEDIETGILNSIKERRWTESINDSTAVREIDETEHEDAPFFFDTVSLDYYIEDDVLANGMLMVDQPDAIIDMDILKKLRDKSETVVWCRNEYHTTDYEICRHDGSYQHDVIGVPEDEVYHPNTLREEEVDDPRV